MSKFCTRCNSMLAKHEQTAGLCRQTDACATRERWNKLLTDVTRRIKDDARADLKKVQNRSQLK